jgi:hypothetical protein
MEVGRWKLEDGSWKTEDGRRKMEDGRRKMEVVGINLTFNFPLQTSNF